MTSLRSAKADAEMDNKMAVGALLGVISVDSWRAKARRYGIGNIYGLLINKPLLVVLSYPIMFRKWD